LYEGLSIKYRRLESKKTKGCDTAATQEIDWEKRISKDPDRYIIVKEGNEMIEIHDIKTNEVWFKVGGNEWMKL